MSANQARQVGWVQLELSDMRLALNMAKMAKGEFLCAAIEETQYLIKKPRTEVREEMQWGVEFPRPKMCRQQYKATEQCFVNHTTGCLSCQTGTAKKPQTPWRHKETVALPLNRCGQLTSDPMPPLPGNAPGTSGNNSGA